MLVFFGNQEMLVFWKFIAHFMDDPQQWSLFKSKPNFPPVFTSSKLIIETLEQSVKYVHQNILHT